MVPIYNGILLSHKKDEIMPFAATCMDLQIIIPSEVSQKIKVKVKLLSRVQLFATLWTVAHQALLSPGFPRQEYWSGLPFPSQGVFLTQGWNGALVSCNWQVDSLILREASI